MVVDYLVPGGKGADGQVKMIPYEVKESLLYVLMHPSLRLSGLELLKRHKIALKIEAAEVEVLLEDAEYAALDAAFKTYQGFGRNEVELVDRVFNALTVPKVVEDKS